MSAGALCRQQGEAGVYVRRLRALSDRIRDESVVRGMRNTRASAVFRIRRWRRARFLSRLRSLSPRSDSPGGSFVRVSAAAAHGPRRHRSSPAAGFIRECISQRPASGCSSLTTMTTAAGRLHRQQRRLFKRPPVPFVATHRHARREAHVAEIGVPQLSRTRSIWPLSRC
jgi:hypothetical protein